MSSRGEGSDEDAVWRSIVANYGERATLDTDEEADAPPAPDPWIERHLAEEHFTPPEPPPLPRPEPRRLLGWVGVLGMPVLVLLAAVFSVAVPSWATLLMLAWFLGGFGYLVATMRRGDDPGGRDGPDDGAIV